MSVINQVLLELEKRRASGAERGVLPDHVRALPEGGREAASWRIAVGCAVAIILLGLAWLAVERYAVPRVSPGAALPPAVAEAAIEKVVSASAAVAIDVPPAREPGGAPRDAAPPVSRLSFELARAPAPQPVAEAPAPARPQAIAAARVLTRADGERNSGAPADTAPVTAAVATAAEASKAQASGPAAAAESATPPAPARVAGPRAADKPAVHPVARTEIEKQVRQPTPRELAEQEYRKAAGFLQQGRLAEAQEGFRAALQLYPGHHGARQALVALFLQQKAHGEAERSLQEGLKLAPEQTGFAMALARLQVERGDNAAAIATLQGSAGHAQTSPDYLAFLAALLQRQGRHEEAIQQFGSALRGKPHTGVWWLGLGMSLQAVNRGAEAQEAYRRAKASNLNPELAAFADQRLRQLQ